MTDTICLTTPVGEPYREIASLVLGGVGTRFDLSYERMDDLQLAVLSMLDAAASRSATVEVVVDDSRLSVSVGPLDEGAESDAGLERVLSKLSDGYEFAARDGGCWATVLVDKHDRAAPPTRV